jgi:hypothetical protein
MILKSIIKTEFPNGRLGNASLPQLWRQLSKATSRNKPTSDNSRNFQPPCPAFECDGQISSGRIDFCGTMGTDYIKMNDKFLGKS